MAIPEAIIRRLAGSPVVRQQRLPGGDISGASEVRLADGRLMVAKYGPVIDVESRMLETMARSDAPVPAVLGQGDDVLLIERLPAGGSLSGKAWLSLAEALHALHARRGDAFGWHEDYALRQIAVENAPLGSWPQFWAERRLLCHVPHIAVQIGKRIERLAKEIDELLPAKPAPCLLHGDLWGGNVLVYENQASGLIDPCAYFGDREVDTASLTVFDDPPGYFFEALGFDEGWRNRQPVYRLWMWLVHVRLFGSSYVSAVERELDALGF
jgi:fructosamine-3-kinase